MRDARFQRQRARLVLKMRTNLCFAISGAALFWATMASAQPAPAPAAPAPATAASATSADMGEQNKAATPGAGVPFPSMLTKDGGDKPEKPFSGQRMSLDDKSIDKDMHQLDGQVDNRLRDLTIGDGKMSPPDVSKYHGELDEISEQQRQIRLLQLKQERATLAMKLWETLYDPRKEEKDAGKSGKDAEAKKNESAQIEPVKPPPVPQQPAQGGEAMQAMRNSLPFPKVVEIFGTNRSLTGVLLVPYIGEMNVVPGTVLPGGRRVVRITTDGVFVSDPTLGTVPLGYGDSVPLSPPAERAPAPSPPGPIAMPPPQPPQFMPGQPTMPQAPK